jgi:tRNA modification GTPase
VPVTLVDTAGLRETTDSIEAEGVRRAKARAADADLVMMLVEAGSASPDSPAAETFLLIASKADLDRPGPDGALRISAKTGIGMGELRACLAEAALRMTESTGPPPLTQARHRAALLAAADHLDAAEKVDLPELRGEDLRLAMRALGRITGHVGVEDILETVFSRFCIGK